VPATPVAAALVALSLLACPSARAEDAKDAQDAKATCANAYDATQIQRRSGKLTAARESAALCMRACPESIRQDCDTWLQQIDAAQPSLVLHARRGAHDLTAVTVELDGRRWVDVLDGRALPLDPGQHVLRLSSDGANAERALFVLEGERNRRVDVDLVAPSPSTPHAPRGPWIVGGVGVAALVAGGIMTGVLLHEKAVNDAGCPGSTCTPAGKSAAETGDALGPVTTATFVVGGAGVAAGAIWLLIARRRTATAGGGSGAGAFDVAPTIASRLRGVAVDVAF
jgi:hypothetical protein